jgi:hypothetical protein
MEPLGGVAYLEEYWGNVFEAHILPLALSSLSISQPPQSEELTPL